jgi:hemerythrin superfamily protein
MKVTVLLRNDHDAVKSMFADYKKAKNNKKEVFNEICREIGLHSQMEAEIFYPALTSTASTNAERLVSSALEEHQAVEKLLIEIAAMSPQDRNFDVKMTSLFNEMNRHIEMEEEQIFGEARQILPEYRLEELGLEMEERRKILTQLAA